LSLILLGFAVLPALSPSPDPRIDCPAEDG